MPHQVDGDKASLQHAGGDAPIERKAGGALKQGGDGRDGRQPEERPGEPIQHLNAE